MKADIGVIGLAVMGQNLALNMSDHGFDVAVYNRTKAKTEDLMQGPGKGTRLIPTYSVQELAAALKKPRRLMLMVKAGEAVDEFIQQLLPHLEKGDIIIDGGNSLFSDTHRRVEECEKKGILYIGAGISGGEEGARHGPSIMPGGSEKAWPFVKPIFQGIAAKVEHGEPCCDWVGTGGSGHFVKMVHNGIEYGDMQLIGEAYHLMKGLLNLSNKEIADIFAEWNQGELESYLIEITYHIFRFKDEDGDFLVDKILDVAGQKGTGKWTVNTALDLGMPLTLISEAVFARCLSALKEERLNASQLFPQRTPTLSEEEKVLLLRGIHSALYASKIISYAQGFMLMRQAAKEFHWKLNFGSVALMWRGGCIIRSKFLGKIKEAYDRNKDLASLSLDPFFAHELQRCDKGWRLTIAKAVEWGIPLPCMSSGLSFFDGYRSGRLPANLLQAQRDYFGAHTYERIDQPRGTFFHTNWTGTGGNVSSSTYNI